MKKKLIPEILLKTICCSCETRYNTCGCRKHGAQNCQRKCSNVEKNLRQLMIHMKLWEKQCRLEILPETETDSFEDFEEH